MLEVMYDTAKATLQLSLKPTINKTIFMDIYIRTYIYIHSTLYKQDLRMALHLPPDYFPITNVCSNHMKRCSD